MEEKKVHVKNVFGSKKKQLEIDLAEISQQMYRRNLDLADSNQALSLLHSIDNIVLESHDELSVLCQKISETVLANSPYPLIAIMANPPHKDFLALSGLASSFRDLPDVSSYKITFDEHNEWVKQSERSVTWNVTEIPSETIARLLKEDTQKVEALRRALPVQSVTVVKLLSRQRLVGLMVFGLMHPKEAITEKDKLLIDRLSDAVGIALDNKLLFEENKQVLLQLQRTNEKLKALDETKDEFISMASHQLRTPLTSVKGYLSMVIEGDAGEVNDMQQKLLGQAFTSSQRMVYLISDLLNLSRLRTGKFVIDSTPVNLATVVTGELEQLQEALAAKKLELVYDPPKKFPTLMMDENKIRQVLMNFIDNAIYYTPANGRIVIELKETKTAIEFTVKDSGIGVPREEQHHLFSKFYRAANARKMRPDGTGLGLFMAKKVIVAQGGALIFESKEGKGSTFGFHFLKKKLALEPEAKKAKS